MQGGYSHEPLRRLQRQNLQEDYCSLPRDLVTEETPCILAPSDNGVFLPMNFVSLPTVEEGHVALRQQTAQSVTMPEEHAAGAKSWHHKAIRRNLSKAKELVLFVGGLRCNLPASQYITYATNCAKTENKSSVGPIFPTLGCFFVTFLSGTSAALARKCFRFTRFHGRIPDLLFLPYISVPRNSEESSYNPLLVFINCKSGGGQGSQLHELMLETLNPSQVFLIDKNGAMPGLYAFRKLACFRILVCGGDGTVGWVLSHLDKAQRHLRCTDPPMAVLPVGTGNDLARVLGYGSGWSGESVDGILAQIQDSEPVKLDRWNVMFDSKPDDHLLSPDPLLLSDAVSFRDDDGDNAKKPLSPINIVMSMGSSNSESLVSYDAGGDRNPTSASMSSARPSPSHNTAGGDAEANNVKILNSHCEKMDGLQRENRVIGDTIKSLNSREDLGTAEDTSSTSATDKDDLITDNIPDDLAAKKATLDVNLEDVQTVHNENKSIDKSEGVETVSGDLTDNTAPEKLVLDEEVCDSSAKADTPDNLVGTTLPDDLLDDKPSPNEVLKDANTSPDNSLADETSPGNLTADEALADSLENDSNRNSATDETSLANTDEAPRANSADDKTTTDNSASDMQDDLVKNGIPVELAADEVKTNDVAANGMKPDNSACDETASDGINSFDSTASGEFTTKLLRQRSGSSTKHRFVQILSASDLDFGPYVGFEEKKTEENGESGEHLKQKTSQLKLIDSNETKALEADNSKLDNQNEFSASADNHSNETKALEADNSKLDDQNEFSASADNHVEIVDEDSFSQPSQHIISKKPPPSRPAYLMRATSETTGKSAHKTVAFNKKLSLPLTPSPSAPKNDVSSNPVDDVKMLVMSNYFGIGIDAELTLAFHLAREENPEKCTSRLRNKALYFKAGLKKMTSRSVNLNNVIDLEVNNKAITLPSIRGLIFLNISSWGAGSHPWGSGVSKRFNPPSLGDGMLEIIGVGGVAHMSQIYSGLRTGTRIAQGEFIKMTLKAEVAVQIDGEPWMQPPGKIVITVSPHQAMMLKKTKKKSK